MLFDSISLTENYNPLFLPLLITQKTNHQYTSLCRKSKIRQSVVTKLLLVSSLYLFFLTSALCILLRHLLMIKL